MNEKRPKISVIVPVYNTEKYLRQCLDTIINQTLKEIEIICVDDGSTDNSLQILKEYQKNDARIVILNQNNGGGGKARNTGLEISTGEYLAFLDSDDYFDLQFLEKMYNQALSDKADLVVCMANTYDIRTNKCTLRYTHIKNQLTERIPFSYLDMKPSDIFNIFGHVPWNKLYRRDMILKNGLRFQEIHRNNDVYFSILSVICANSITLVKEPLVYYRVGMNTNTQSRICEHPLEFTLSFSAILDKLTEDNLIDYLKQQYVNYVFEVCLVQEKKLRKCDSHRLIYDFIKSVLFVKYEINAHDLGYYYNKLFYYQYLKMISLPYSKYTNGKIIENIYFTLSHPIVGLHVILYLTTMFIRYSKENGLRYAFNQYMYLTN